MDAPAAVLIADVLFDGDGGEPVPRPAITLREGRIETVVARAAGWRPPDDLELVDCEGASVAPGLIDTHVHLAFEGATSDEIVAFAGSAGPDELRAAMCRHAAEALRAGVTTVRDCGAPGRSSIELRDLLAAGAVPGPSLVACGRPITTPTGHCHWMGVHAQTAPELCAAVRELVTDGADAVKVMVTGGMMTAGSDPYVPQYAAEELTAAVAEAHAHGRRVAGHVLCAAGLRVALAAGVDTVEHGYTITGGRQDDDPALAAAMAAAGTFGSVTAHWALRALVEAGKVDELRRRLAPHRGMYAAGVRMVAHSDAGTPRTRFDEFALSVEAFREGMDVSVSRAIQAASATAAEALGLAGEVGRVAPRLRADLLVADGDLRTDPRALRRVRRVIQGGRTTVVDGAFAAFP